MLMVSLLLQVPNVYPCTNDVITVVLIATYWIAPFVWILSIDHELTYLQSDHIMTFASTTHTRNNSTCHMCALARIGIPVIHIKIKLLNEVQHITSYYSSNNSSIQFQLSFNSNPKELIYLIADQIKWNFLALFTIAASLVFYSFSS
jgi:hypothetical protein